MLAQRFSREHDSPHRYAVGDAFDSYMLPHTRAFDLPRILGKPKVRMNLQHPLLGLMDAVSGERDATSAHVMGDPLGEAEGDSPILRLLREFHQQVHPVVSGYMGQHPDVIRWLAAHKQASGNPAVSRSVENYLGTRRPGLEHLLDIAAEHDIHADYDSYKDNHGLKTLLSLYDAMGRLRAGYTPTMRLPQRNNGQVMDAVFMDDAVDSAVDSHLRDLHAGTRGKAETVQRSIAHQLRQNTLPLIGRLAGPIGGIG